MSVREACQKAFGKISDDMSACGFLAQVMMPSASRDEIDAILAPWFSSGEEFRQQVNDTVSQTEQTENEIEQ